MANNKLDVTVDVKVNGNEALAEISKLKSDISGVGSNVTGEMNKASNSVRSTGNEFTGLSGKVRAFSESFSGLNGVMSSVMGTVGLGSFKSLTLDMAMTRDQAKNLLAVTMQGSQTFAQASQTADTFITKIKEGTSGSVVKLQMMIEAMNGIKLSTGMANSDLESLNDVIRKVGEASLLMGDDTEHATFVMKEAMSGLNGDFQVLKEQFGITADKMKAAGWSGAADDVQGYRQALEQCLSGLGDMGQVMDTTSGKINKIKSNFSSAGLEIGNTMLPAVDLVASAFLDANENGNLLAKGILYAGGAASTFASLAPTLKPMFETYDSIKGAVDDAKGATESLTKATEIMDGVTAALTGTKAAETVATEADAVAETTDAAAKSANNTATAVGTGEHIGFSAALGAAASSAWALTSALLASPYTWIAVAVIALVAVMWHLYNTNEEFRNGVNNLINTLKGGLIQAWNTIVSVAQQVWAGLQKLGQIIWSMLVPAWQQFKAQLQPLWIALLQLGDTLRALWANITGGAGAVDDAGNSFNVLAVIGQAVGAVIVGLARVIITGLQVAFAIIIPVITLFVDVLSTIIGVASSIQGVFNQLRNGTMSVGDAIGAIGEIFVGAFGDILQAVVQFGTSLLQNFGMIITGIVPNIGAIFSQIMITVQMKILEIKLLIITQVTTFINQVVMRIYSIVTGVRRVFSLVVNTIMLRLNQARAIAGMLAMMIRNMIVTRFNLIVARTRAIFGNIVNAIRQRLSSAVSAARTKAQQILQGIRDKVAQIPEAVKQEFDKIKEKIRSALDAAKNVAVSKINDLVSAVKGALGIASPGFIQRMVTWEFNSLEGIIDDSGIRATNSAAKAATSIVGTWNSNMTSLGVSMEERFDAFNPLRAITDMPHVGADLNIVGNKMNGATTTPNNNISTNNTVNNDDHTIIYQVDHMTVDLNQLPGTEKERFYNMLSELFPGGA